MYKIHIIRNELYPEESRDENIIFNHSVCVTLKRRYTIMGSVSESFVVDRSIEEELRPVHFTEFESLQLYVRSEKVALELAQRYCDEKNKENSDANYDVVGIDKAFSIFD